MKNFIFLIGFLSVLSGLFAQNQTQSYDYSFKTLYKAVALHPGYRNKAGKINDSVIRRWDKDIKIFIEGGNAKCRREIQHALRDLITRISPAIGDKIKIFFTDEKYSANYLVNLNGVGRSSWYIKWDGNQNIYSGLIVINTNAVFNRDEQTERVTHYFLESLGDFVLDHKDRSNFDKNDPTMAANISAWRHDISDVDLQILKLHYSDAIKPGMSEKDLDLVFK